MLGIATGTAGLLGLATSGCGSADYGPLTVVPGSADVPSYPDAAYGPPSCVRDEDCTRYSQEWVCEYHRCVTGQRPDAGEGAGE